MRTEIAREYRFEAAHRLPNVPAEHKCARLHGHSFRVTVTVSGELDPVLGWIVDFAAIDEAWKPIHAALDHRYLNDVDGLANPTSEIVAQWIAERLRLPAAARIASITVHETCNASATVFP